MIVDELPELEEELDKVTVWVWLPLWPDCVHTLSPILIVPTATPAVPGLSFQDKVNWIWTLSPLTSIFLPSAENSQNFTQCDSLLIGDECGAITIPYIEVKNPTAKLEHEASTSKVSDEQLFYLMQRGLDEEEAHHMIITGWSKEVFKELPFEFAVEAGQLLKVSLEGSVG